MGFVVGSRTRVLEVCLEVVVTTGIGAGPKDKEFASWRSYWSYWKTVRHARRYVWPIEVREFLDSVRRTAKKRELVIPENMPFYRAQVGWKYDVKELKDGTLSGPRAFGPHRMKPKASRAREGRANAAGIPVLYLAFEIETAIAETRPWIGSQVSVSQFRTTRELRVLDLTQGVGEHWMPAFLPESTSFKPVTAEEKEKSAWISIDNAFSQPVGRTDDASEYVPTQILAEVFRDEGYEAIIYRSLLGAMGHNVVIFDLADAGPVDGRPYEVKEIHVAAEEAGNPWVKTPT